MIKNLQQLKKRWTQRKCSVVKKKITKTVKGHFKYYCSLKYVHLMINAVPVVQTGTRTNPVNFW